MKKPAKDKSNHIPVVIGNYSPFRLVLRDGDSWKPTLEEINQKQYDYVKLCRLSSFIDIGIAPFSLGITFDGSLILPATLEFRNKEAALNKFNETLGILLLGGIYSEAIHPDDITIGELFFDGYLKLRGNAYGSNSCFHRGIQTTHVGILDVIRLLEPRQITSKEVEEGYSRGKKYFTILNKVSPSLLLNGTSNFVKRQWPESLIFLWTSVEQVINFIWKKEIIKNKSEDIIEGRTDFLKDYRTWTASTQIEVLYQKGFIKAKEYQLLNTARKSRNEFIHYGKELTEEKVRCALEALFRLISLTITDYEKSDKLDVTLNQIFSNQRDDLYQKDSQTKVTHWLHTPPLPGDKGWGNKKYEIIEDLVLQPLKK